MGQPFMGQSFMGRPVAARPAVAAGAFAAGESPARQCRRAVATAERAAGIPAHLLAAIARVETGRADGEGGVSPYPWSINVEGVDHIYDSKAAAMAGVAAFQLTGIRSIDVGCLQVNLMYHPGAFASLADAFDPATNAAYAARFLTELYAKTGSWPRATAMYHSADPEIGGAYGRRVAAVLPEEQRRGDEGTGMLAARPVPGPTGLPASGLAQAGMAMPGAIMPGAAPAGGTGAIMLSNRPDLARFLPASGGMGGRGLNAYRSAPIPVASIPVASIPVASIPVASISSGAIMPIRSAL